MGQRGHEREERREVGDGEVRGGEGKGEGEDAEEMKGQKGVGRGDEIRKTGGGEKGGRRRNEGH